VEHRAVLVGIIYRMDVVRGKELPEVLEVLQAIRENRPDTADMAVLHRLRHHGWVRLVVWDSEIFNRKTRGELMKEGRLKEIIKKQAELHNKEFEYWKFKLERSEKEGYDKAVKEVFVELDKLLQTSNVADVLSRRFDKKLNKLKQKFGVKP
jgi:hypothetical protein